MKFCGRVFLLSLFGIWISQLLIKVDVVDAKPRYLIKFATVAPEGSSWIKHMRKLDGEIRAKSDGRVGFRVYAGGIAGDELDVLRKIRIGQIHCAAFTGVGFGQILPVVRVLDLPFLFQNYDETDAVHRELRPFLAGEFRKRGFELLAWAEVGNVHLFSKKRIERVKDLSGLKVWAWSGDPIANETFAAMGTNPIQLAITDVTTALGTGMIDTVYAPPLGALALQWHTSVDYMTALPLAHSTGAVLISSKYYDKLPQDLAGLLDTMFEEAMTELTSELRGQNKEALKAIQNTGLTIVPPPSGASLQEFYKIHDEVARKLTGEIYPKKTLDRVYGIMKRPR
ncbi:MAG: TRAP transporter substrate-binding protein DctP [Thermodesulfobacteriota bacterium]|nr:TRAP transporter substrate-binding protein DctP [Thermodesulfobacteriota bacterium]